ncbi:MAG TPA: dihydrolipoamide acetyltransferase family protein [Trebonia sp.]|jgi:pyruvate dehydrogenase E2 component (dihydrolipoamide acetyltransferase)|nr:dihydrolipoamide acetyltransferase family protein [Trebonia sp.]
MASVVRMPSVLAGASEAAIASWLVAPGDSVAVGQPLAEIETEKALVEYAAEQAGVVGRLVLAAGDTGGIGDPIAVLVADGETDADIDAALGSETPAPAQAPAPTVAAAPAPSGTRSMDHRPPEKAVDGPSTANGQQPTAPERGSRIFASPLVRKIAGERGIDLAAIAGTGPNGRIVRRDLEQFLATQPERVEPEPVQTPAPVQASTPVVAGDRLVPHTPMRRAIARRLTESKATTPHFYMVTECVVDELLELRKRINESSPVKISVNDFVVMAAGAAFRDVPEANVTWTDEGMLEHGSVDISIAVATEGGLVTPVLRGVDGKRLSDVARESQDLARRARERRLRQDELEGGTFSISNLGMYGTLEFSGIINPPQSGLLAVGAARQQPVVTDGAVTVATVMRCTLSIDHRALDGALAARWLAAFTIRLEHPLGTIV